MEKEMEMRLKYKIGRAVIEENAGMAANYKLVAEIGNAKSLVNALILYYGKENNANDFRFYFNLRYFRDLPHGSEIIQRYGKYYKNNKNEEVEVSVQDTLINELLKDKQFNDEFNQFLFQLYNWNKENKLN